MQATFKKIFHKLRTQTKKAYDLYNLKINGITPLIHSRDIDKARLLHFFEKEVLCIVEIGSNNGDDTLHFLSIFSSAFIYCFEPDPRAANKWKRNLNGDTRALLVEKAVSQSDGTMKFYQSSGFLFDKNSGDEWDQSGSLRKPKEHELAYPSVKFENTINVHTTTFDSFFFSSSLPSVDLLWMDVQGCELDVLLSAQNALKHVRYLYTEYSNSELYEGQASLKQICRALSGWTMVERYSENVLFRNDRFDLFNPF
jgi:FkbM family methyltransferase